MYFYDGEFGVTHVPDDICRIWIDYSSFIQLSSFNPNIKSNYNCIRKSKNKDYFEYFRFSSIDGTPPLEPKNVYKLVKIRDAYEIGMIVGSQFSRIEQNLRNLRNKNK